CGMCRRERIQVTVIGNTVRKSVVKRFARHDARHHRTMGVSTIFIVRAQVILFNYAIECTSMHRVIAQIESTVGYTYGISFSAEVRRHDRDRPSRNLTPLFYLGNEGTPDGLKIGGRLPEHRHVMERLGFEPFANGPGKGSRAFPRGSADSYD